MMNELTYEVTALGTDRPGPPPPAPRRPWRRRAGAFGVIGVAALVAAGCGSSAKTSTPAAAPTSVAPTTAAAATAAPTTLATPTATTTITATLTEFKIALSQSALTPGTYTFHAVNAGQTVHGLEVDGPGLTDKATPGVLQPGQSADLTVTLKAGRYDVYCPVGQHKALGMNLEVTVAGATTTAATATPSTPTTATSAAGGGYGY